MRFKDSLIPELYQAIEGTLSITDVPVTPPREKGIMRISLDLLDNPEATVKPMTSTVEIASPVSPLSAKQSGGDNDRSASPQHLGDEDSHSDCRKNASSSEQGSTPNVADTSQETTWICIDSEVESLHDEEASCPKDTLPVDAANQEPQRAPADQTSDQDATPSLRIEVKEVTKVQVGQDPSLVDAKVEPQDQACAEPTENHAQTVQACGAARFNPEIATETLSSDQEDTANEDSAQIAAFLRNLKSEIKGDLTHLAGVVGSLKQTVNGRLDKLLDLSLRPHSFETRGMGMPYPFGGSRFAGVPHPGNGEQPSVQSRLDAEGVASAARRDAVPHAAGTMRALHAAPLSDTGTSPLSSSLKHSIDDIADMLTSMHEDLIDRHGELREFLDGEAESKDNTLNDIQSCLKSEIVAQLQHYSERLVTKGFLTRKLASFQPLARTEEQDRMQVIADAQAQVEAASQGHLKRSADVLEDNDDTPAKRVKHSNGSSWRAAAVGVLIGAGMTFGALSTLGA